MIEINPDLVIQQQIVNRVQANKNWLGVICGATGSGKSWWSLALCEQYFPGFDTNNIVFNVNEWLKRFTELYEDKAKGEIILFDEGEDWSARRAMETRNVEFSNILAMIRFTNISSIFTLPDIRMIDVNLIRLMHSYIYVIDVDRKSQYTPEWQRTRTGAHFWEIMKEKLPEKAQSSIFNMVRYPRVPIQIHNKTSGEYYEKTVKIPKIWFKAPSNALLDEYESLKNKHFGRSLMKAMDRIKRAEDNERKKGGYFSEDEAAQDRAKIKSDKTHAKAMGQILGTVPSHTDNL
jgi:hypothetical protein